MPSSTREIAFVTGAGSGIGRAIAERLASDRVAVAAADVDLPAAQQTADRVRSAGGTCVPLAVDISDFEAVQAAVGETREQLGAPTILVNNAGWDQVEPFTDNTPELWDRLIRINLKGPIHCCRAVLDDMIAAQRGKIVSISSDAARVGSTGEAVYAACKGGIVSFSKTLAREMARHKININVVCPGPTDTNLLAEITAGDQGANIIAAMKRAVPFRRLGRPEEVAAAVAFFAGSDADFITGQVLSVSGGLTMAG